MPLKDGTRANAVFWHGRLLLLLLLWLLLLNDWLLLLLVLLQLDRRLRSHNRPSVGHMLQLLLLRWRLTRVDYYLLLAVKGRVQPRRMLAGAVGRCWRYPYHAGSVTRGGKRRHHLGLLLLWYYCGLGRSQQFRSYQGRLLGPEIHRYTAGTTEAMQTTTAAAAVHDGTGSVCFEFAVVFGGGRCRTSDGHEDVLPVPDGHR